jgi:hypothetical protein
MLLRLRIDWHGGLVFFNSLKVIRKFIFIIPDVFLIASIASV